MANKKPNTKGLKPFKKGESGNPKGKPKGVSVTQYLRELMDEEIDMAIKNSAGQTIRVERHTLAKAIAMRIRDLALKGDGRIASSYIQMIQDRLEGKVAQQIEVKAPKMDLSKLTNEELKALRTIYAKTQASDL